MRAARLVRLLLLLQTRGKMTGADLATELEVSVRTVYRDLEALSGAGVPVYAEAGPGGGCRLLEGYRSRLTGLSAREAEALLAAAPAGPLAELGLGTALVDAQLKVLAELPEPLRERAVAVSQRFHLDAAGWFRGGNMTLSQLAVLARAVWEDRRVRLHYRPRGGDGAARTVDPFGLVAKAGVWYLVARGDDQVRAYRVSRVAHVEVLPDAFQRPDGFDLAEFWAAWAAEFEAGLPFVEIVVRINADDVSRLRSAVDTRFRDAIDWEGTAIADGRREVTVVFERVEHARGAALRLAGCVEVVSPAELRAELAEAGARIEQAHSLEPAPI
jgi:predicted DNA-binding transcriptional regulator YafY